MKTYIYILSDSEGIKYVGKSDSPEKRLKIHLKESKLRRTRKERWINDLLKNKEIPTLEIIDVVDSSDWSFFESYWILQFKSWGIHLLNGTDGGEGSNGFKGKTHSEKTKEKLRELSIGKSPTEETRKKISESNKNRIFSDSTKEKISEKAKQRFSEESKRKDLSETMKKYYREIKNFDK